MACIIPIAGHISVSILFENPIWSQGPSQTLLVLGNLFQSFPLRYVLSHDTLGNSIMLKYYRLWNWTGFCFESKD